jgi:branched-chain amino acid transport system permease protein
MKIFIALVVLVILLLPIYIHDSYFEHELNLVFIYIIFMLGLNLLTGYAGQISLGHTAFYAIGAYTTAILVQKCGINQWLTIPLAGFLTFFCGLLFSLPLRRLSLLYLTLATLSLALTVPQLLKRFSAFTGGTQGINIAPPVIPFHLLTLANALYVIAFLIMLLIWALSKNLVRGYIGRAMMAIRENPLAAEAMGINTAYYKAVTFGISAAYAGIAGSLLMIVLQFVSPDMFDLYFALLIFIALVFGGLGNLYGALFSALFLQFMPQFSVSLSKGGASIVLGLILILTAFVMPYGVANFLKRR